MRIGFAVTDIQDFFLFRYLIDLYLDRGHEVILYYDNRVKKLTSVRFNKSSIRIPGCITIPYLSMKNCIAKANGKVDLMITNEGMPFEGRIKLPFKMYGLSWTIEHYFHGPRFLHLCDLFFCDDPIVKKLTNFDRYKTKVIYKFHPKYYCLHNRTREEVCTMLNIPASDRYVTILAPAPALYSNRRQEDIRVLVKFFTNRHYSIIVKQKPKDQPFKMVKARYKMVHKHKKYSTSVLLAYISDFVIGFNTSGIIESVKTRTPFINLFLKHKKINYKRHPQFKINNERILRLDRSSIKRVKQFVASWDGYEKCKEYPIAEELDL